MNFYNVYKFLLHPAVFVCRLANYRRLYGNLQLIHSILEIHVVLAQSHVLQMNRKTVCDFRLQGTKWG